MEDGGKRVLVDVFCRSGAFLFFISPVNLNASLISFQ